MNLKEHVSAMLNTLNPEEKALLKKREIFSFPSDVIGGDKEIPTRIMILAGKAWIDANPDRIPRFELSPTTKIMKPVNYPAEELLNAILAAGPGIKMSVDGKPVSGFDESMVQTAINHCSFIRNMGWNGYVHQMTPK